MSLLHRMDGHPRGHMRGLKEEMDQNSLSAPWLRGSSRARGGPPSWAWTERPASARRHGQRCSSCASEKLRFLFRMMFSSLISFTLDTIKTIYLLLLLLLLLLLYRLFCVFFFCFVLFFIYT